MVIAALVMGDTVDDKYLWWGLAAVLAFLVLQHHQPFGYLQGAGARVLPAGGGCGCNGPAPILADPGESVSQSLIGSIR